MAAPYTLDLRHRVIDAMLLEGMAPEAAARRFAIGRMTAYRWRRAALEGRRAALPMSGHPPAKVQGEVASKLAELVDDAPALRLIDYAEQLEAATGVRVSLATMCRNLQRLGLTRNKAELARRRAGCGPGGGIHGRDGQRRTASAGVS